MRTEGCGWILSRNHRLLAAARRASVTVESVTVIALLAICALNDTVTASRAEGACGAAGPVGTVVTVICASVAGLTRHVDDSVAASAWSFASRSAIRRRGARDVRREIETVVASFAFTRLNDTVATSRPSLARVQTLPIGVGGPGAYVALALITRLAKGGLDGAVTAELRLPAARCAGR